MDAERSVRIISLGEAFDPALEGGRGACAETEPKQAADDQLRSFDIAPALMELGEGRFGDAREFPQRLAIPSRVEEQVAEIEGGIPIGRVARYGQAKESFAVLRPLAESGRWYHAMPS